jgi:hypothetical protein
LAAKKRGPLQILMSLSLLEPTGQAHGTPEALFRSAPKDENFLKDTPIQNMKPLDALDRFWDIRYAVTSPFGSQKLSFL